MKRKIIQLGTSTLVTSLPSKWAKEHHLKAGDEVEVTQENGHLSINVNSKAPPSRKLVEIPSSSVFMERLIHTPYRFGVDELEVRFKDLKTIDQIQVALDKHLGFEIVEQSKEKMIIRNVAEGMDDKFEQLLHRTFLLILEMSREIASSTEKKDSKRLLEISYMEKTIDKLTNFCERLINKGKVEGTATFLYVLVWSLEEISNGLQRTAELISEHRSFSVGPFLHRFSHLFELYYQAYKKPTLENLFQCKKEQQRFERSGQKFIIEHKGIEAVAVSNLLILSHSLYHLNLSFLID
ncbi:MAG: AbrB/MazE/SpoVT family DNA-binding domain-containing protein [Nanoarchaeota archaeon]